MSVSQSPESESQSPNPAGDESGQINRPTKAEALRRRAAYAFGNLGQSAFYNALSTYFVDLTVHCQGLTVHCHHHIHIGVAT